MMHHTVNKSVFGLDPAHRGSRQMPAGSGLLISFAIGATGWYAIGLVVRWLTGA